MKEEIRKENQEHFETMKQALDLIDNRAFEILNTLELEVARTFIKKFRQAHDELLDQVTHLANLAGLEVEE